jgi:hypothetical protein
VDWKWAKPAAKLVKLVKGTTGLATKVTAASTEAEEAATVTVEKSASGLATEVTAASANSCSVETSATVTVD